MKHASCVRVAARKSVLPAEMPGIAPEVCVLAFHQGCLLILVPDCQKLDWKNHKVICPSFADPKPEITEMNVVDKDALPNMIALHNVHSVDYKRVLLFPGGNIQPRFVWIKVWFAPDAGDLWDHTQFFGRSPIGFRSWEYNSIQSRSILRSDYGLVIQANELFGDQEHNRAVSLFTRSGDCAGFVRGPILIASVSRDEFGSFSVRDIDMRDARNAGDLFTTLYRPGYFDRYHNEQTIMATRVACEGEPILQPEKIKDRYRLFQLDDPILEAKASEISNLLGIPILVRANYVEGEEEHNTGHQAAGEHLATMYLMRNITSTQAGEEGFGSSPRGSKYYHTVWGIRAAGLPLPFEHMEALVGYIHDKVEPRLTESLSGVAIGEAVPGREAVLASITSADFEEYYNAKMAASLSSDPKFLMKPSPYAMDEKFINSWWDSQSQ